MKTLKFNEKSWHYYVAGEWGGFRAPYRRYEDDEHMSGDSPDICTYTRKFLKGLFFLSLVSVVILAMGIFAGALIFGLVSGIVHSILCGCFAFSQLGEGALAILVIVAIFVIAMILSKVTSNYFEKRRIDKRNAPEVEDGFIKHAYKSWKGKYCMMIEFKK